MKSIIIREPFREDTKEIHELFLTVIHDAFRKEMENPDFDEVISEVEQQKKNLDNYFTTKGKDEFCIIALSENIIIGTLSFGKAQNMILKHMDSSLHHLPEIKTAYVLPDYQHQGVLKNLYKALFNELTNRGYEEALLDCGYQIASGIYHKKLGAPTLRLPDHWGKGIHHNFWKIDLHSDIFKNI